MKWIFRISLIWLTTLSSCDLRQREQELEKKISEVNQKEQALLLKEESLRLKEEELDKKQRSLGSTSDKVAPDSLAILHPEVTGRWTVKMRCTETNCPGSAVGDIKTEQWEIGYQGNVVMAKALTGNQLVRVYTGSYSGKSLELSAQQTDTISSQARIVVRIQRTKENEMEGQREITREGNCRIVYALELKKQ